MSVGDGMVITRQDLLTSPAKGHGDFVPGRLVIEMEVVPPNARRFVAACAMVQFWLFSLGEMLAAPPSEHSWEAADILAAIGSTATLSVPLLIEL